MPSVFFSYSHADESLRDQLEKQLSMLKRQGVIETWHDRRIGAGAEFARAIDEHVERDEIILLLVSADFLASEYCYEIEMQRAMERHNAGEAIVIPVILRACDWRHAPFGKLYATPRDGKPVTQWPDIDEAFLQVAQAVREAATRAIGGSKKPQPTAGSTRPGAPASTTSSPRSSNLRLAKTFTQRDKDKFQLDTFEFIARYFENSLAELAARNPGFEGVFRRIDATRFFATIYRNGDAVARATIYIGGSSSFGGINYAHGETSQSNSLNEALTVQADDETLYFNSMGMASLGAQSSKRLSQEGAAELFWGILIKPLQQQSVW